MSLVDYIEELFPHVFILVKAVNKLSHSHIICLVHLTNLQTKLIKSMWSPSVIPHALL